MVGSEKKDAVRWTGKTDTNSIGMEFVYIEPTGDKGFTMGSSSSPEEVEKRYGGDAKYHEDQRPQHKVILTKGLYLNDGGDTGTDRAGELLRWE